MGPRDGARSAGALYGSEVGVRRVVVGSHEWQSEVGRARHAVPSPYPRQSRHLDRGAELRLLGSFCFCDDGVSTRGTPRAKVSGAKPPHSTGVSMLIEVALN